MKISELGINQGRVEVEGIIVKKGSLRRVENEKFKGIVQEAVLKDDSGEIKITLWNEDCEKINEGDKVKIINGFVKEFQGEKQLSAGKFGRIEIVVEE